MLVYPNALFSLYLLHGLLYGLTLSTIPSDMQRKAKRTTSGMVRAQISMESSLGGAWRSWMRTRCGPRMKVQHMANDSDFLDDYFSHPSQINYDALVELMCLLADEQQRQGASAFLSDWPEATKYLQKKQAAPGGAVLVFLPGAPEISRLQRALQASEKLAVAAGGRQKLRILPLHGSLSSSDQTRVFSRCALPALNLATPVVFS